MKYIINIVLFIIIILFIYYIFSFEYCKKEIVQDNFLKLHNIFSNKIIELSFVTSTGGKNETLCYMKTNSINIINEFQNIITNETFIPRNETGQFSYNILVTIKTKSGLHSMELYYKPYNPTVEKHSVDIAPYAINFNIYDAYIYTCNRKEPFHDYIFFNYRKVPCSQFRNNKLHLFIEKYLKEAIFNGKSNTKYFISECRDE